MASNSNNPTAIQRDRTLEDFLSPHIELLSQKVAVIKRGYKHLLDEEVAILNKAGILSFDPCDVCNLKCVGCSYSNDHGAVSLPFDALDSLLMFAPRVIDITGGGEPTLYRSHQKQFSDLLLRIRYLLPATRIRLFTNGTYLPSGDWQEAIDWIRVSIDAASEDTFNLIKGHRLLNTVLANLKLYLCGPIPDVHVSYLFQEGNILESVRFALLTRELLDSWAGHIHPEKLANFTIQYRPRQDYAPYDAPRDWQNYGSAHLTQQQKSILLSGIQALDSSNRHFVNTHTNISVLWDDYGAEEDSPEEDRVPYYYGMMIPYLRADGHIYPDCQTAAVQLHSFGNVLTSTAIELATQQLELCCNPPDYVRKHCKRFTMMNAYLKQCVTFKPPSPP